MDETTLVLPDHAIRYLRQMCAEERIVLNDLMTSTFGEQLQIQAAFDSLNAIESVLPDE